MADNVGITAGSGTVVSTEEITTLNGGAVAAQHMQRVDVAIRTGDGIGADLPGDASNGLDVDVTRLPRSGTATLSNVAASASSVTLIASNTARKKVIIYNDTALTCYVKYGSTASSSSYTHQLQAGEKLEEDTYTGIITGLWTGSSGSARVTELT